MPGWLVCVIHAPNSEGSAGRGLRLLSFDRQCNQNQRRYHVSGSEVQSSYTSVVASQISNKCCVRMMYEVTACHPPFGVRLVFSVRTAVSLADKAA
jgi:hypothetical protein